MYKKKLLNDGLSKKLKCNYMYKFNKSYNNQYSYCIFIFLKLFSVLDNFVCVKTILYVSLLVSFDINR